MKILEINLVSAQGLKLPAANLRRIQTYAVAWVDPSLKLRTKVDSLGGENPTWNDKFLFRVSDDFISGETSAVSVEIYAVGYIRDLLIGTVRFLLSNCLSIRDSFSTLGTPSFTAVQIRRPSGRFQGVLNLGAAVYNPSDFSIMENVSAACFRDLVKKNVPDSPSNRRWKKLSRVGSKRSDLSSGSESCDFSDGSDMTTSSSASDLTALKDINGVIREMAGIKKSSGRNTLCGLMMMQRRIPSYPSDQNLEFWDKEN